MDSDEEFTPPPSKRRARSVSQEDKNDPSYRGNRGASPRSKQSDYFPASQLFEYQWPLGETTAEYFMLQEQVKEFLDIRGIQRKYPDWRRRTLELDERKFLVGMGVVTETLSNMGLVALHSEEVLEAMADDYPNKYAEYAEVLKEKEFQQTLRNKVVEARRLAVATAQLDADEVARINVRTEALRGVAQFNRQLATQRNTLAKAYIDPHTKLQQVPKSLLKPHPVPVKTRYPAALLPGQYSEHYPIFTSQELSQLPLNTVSGVPEYMCEKATNVAQSQQSSSVGQGSTNPDSGGQKLAAIPSTIKDNLLKMIDSQFSEPAAGGRPASLLGSIQKLLSSYASGGGSITKKSVDSPQPSSVSNTRRSSLTELLRSEGSSGKGSVDQQAREATKDDKEIVAGKGSSEEEMINKPDSNVLEAESERKIDDKKLEETEKFEKSDVSVTPVLRSKKANVRTALCSVCRKGRGSNMKGIAEDLIQCTQCGIFVHPSCYKLPPSILPILKLYNWQCLECKTCEVCNGANEEDKMVFCDECDRGYHSFCVGMDQVPSGKWVCQMCGKCGSCGTDKPGPASKDSWKHEYLDGRFIHTHCVECAGYFSRGYYCPVCYKVYRNDHTDSSMVCCDSCDSWIHTDCDGISKPEYDKLSTENSSYICSQCRNKM